MATSRLASTRGDVAACWRAAARLTVDKDEARRLREHTKMVSGINAWIRQHGSWIDR